MEIPAQFCVEINSVQFLASRRAGRPVIPQLFWYMSLIGSLMTLSYFLFSSKPNA